MARSANAYDASKGSERLADRLARINAQGIQRAVVETTLEAKEAVIDKITNEIRPHSGLGRKRNPEETVTDLVDTGLYRASWQESFPVLFQGVLSSNLAYTAPLEYGTEHMEGFFVARDTAYKMRAVFKDKVKRYLKETLR